MKGLSVCGGHSDDAGNRCASLLDAECCGCQKQRVCIEVECDGSGFDVSQKCLGAKQGVDMNITNAVPVKGRIF